MYPNLSYTTGRSLLTIMRTHLLSSCVLATVAQDAPNNAGHGYLIPILPWTRAALEAHVGPEARLTYTNVRAGEVPDGGLVIITTQGNDDVYAFTGAERVTESTLAEFAREAIWKIVTAAAESKGLDPAMFKLEFNPQASP